MNQKQLALVRYVLKKEDPITAKELAMYLNVSIRTVKNYVSVINEEFSRPVIISSNLGYVVNKRIAKEYLKKKAENTVPETYEERANYINKKYLMAHTNSMNIYDLSEELFVSFQTLKSDLKKMNKSFENFYVTYEVHGDNAYMFADEKSLRKLARFTLFDNDTANLLDYSLLKKVFEEIDIDALKLALTEVLDRFNFYMNDFSRMNLVLHLAIILMRIKNNNSINRNETTNLDEDSLEYKAVESLIEKLTNHFMVVFNPQEKDNIYLLIKSNVNVTLTSNDKDISRYVGKEFLDFTKEVIKKVNTQYYVDLSNKPFISLLALHLKNLLFRIQNHQTTIDPIDNLLRYSYPIIFDMAVYIALLFEKKFNIIISENEVSYIALHIGGEMERQKLNDEKIKVLLLCPNYLDFDTKMHNHLIMCFGNEIDLIARVNSPEQIKKYTFDLLITTMSLQTVSSDYEIIEVPLLGIDNYKLKIETCIEAIKDKQRTILLKQNFEHFFSKELFLVDKKDDLGKKEAMKRMADKMIAMEVVQSDFYERILERDTASSTGFPNIAIPHSVNMDAIKTSVCTMLCPSGIQWDGQHVKIILAIAIHKADRNIFQELYQSLVRLFNDEKNVNLLVKTDSFESFEQKLLALI